ADTDRLVGAHVGLVTFAQGLVARPEIEQLLLEGGVDLLPNRDDLETHLDLPPVAGREAGCGPIWRTITTYSSNCSLPSLLASNLDSGGALSPARRTSTRLRNSSWSSAPSSLRSTRSNWPRRRVTAARVRSVSQPLRNSSRDNTPLWSASHLAKTASPGCASARTPDWAAAASGNASIRVPSQAAVRIMRLLRPPSPLR